MAEKLAACFNCRRGKMKCLRNTAGDSASCVGCVQRGVRCVRPAYHLGRNPGSRNKLSGLQKAICQIENAMHGEDASSRHDRELLHAFLSKIGSESPRPVSRRQAASPGHVPHRVQMPQWPQIPTHGRSREAIHGAETPLLLIAQAPEELAHETTRSSSVGTAADVARRLNHQPQPSHSPYDTFFGPFQPVRDVDPELDPIELGLVDMTEAEKLFAFFYQNLSEMRWGLDPAIHSAQFVHRRSLFLFTSILAVSTLFIPTAGTLSKRLRLHCRRLADIITNRRMRSVEIVLAFMVNVPWLTPGTHWADDETWMYLSTAATIALDLSLDKVVLHPGTDKNMLEWSKTHPSECIDVQKVMDMEGFSDVDVTSELGRRLLRRRERVWLTLWGLERGVCLARGRRWSVPVTSIVDFCDNWHMSDIAAQWDDSLVPAMVLRRDLLPAIEKLKAGLLRKVSEASADTALSPHQEIETFFENWLRKCPCITTENGESKLPPYVDILSCHTRLTAYAHLINLPTATPAIRRQFRAAAFSAALCVLRTAVQREAEMMAIPNNSVIMIAFSAVFAIQITSSSERGTSSLTSTVIGLIHEVGNVLERIGNITPHRNGISALFAVHIRRIVQLATTSMLSKCPPEEAPAMDAAVSEASVPLKAADVGQDASSTIGFMGGMPEQTLDFSDISMDQITDMIDAMGDGLGVYGWGLDMDSFPDPNFLDWEQFA